MAFAQEIIMNIIYNLESQNKRITVKKGAFGGAYIDSEIRLLRLTNKADRKQIRKYINDLTKLLESYE